ncbi:MAG: PilZ domain-containing protein [Myxococcota bacterium]
MPRVAKKRCPAPRRRRRILRRARRTTCQAVGLEGFRLLGDRILDLSPHGAMVAADAEVSAGEPVMLSFELDGEYVDAEAVVARVIEGWRPNDPGYAMGLRFTSIALQERLRIAGALEGTPPPVPTRELRPGL